MTLSFSFDLEKKVGFARLNTGQRLNGLPTEEWPPECIRSASLCALQVLGEKVQHRDSGRGLDFRVPDEEWISTGDRSSQGDDE